MCYVYESAETTLVFGDSHALSFANIPNVTIHYIGPWTMHRVGRDGLNVEEYGVVPKDVVVYCFGEVDARCHIGRLRDLGGNQEQIISDLAERYTDAIANNVGNSIVYSVTPPSNFRPPGIKPQYGPFSRYGTINDRILITRELNAKLKDISEEKGLLYLDVFAYYSTQRGILRKELSDGIAHISVEHNGYIAKCLGELLNIL